MERNDAQTPLAIIGMACLFPKADGLSGYWANVKRRVDAITEIPETHWKPEDYFDADPKRPDFTYARRGGFLEPVPFDPAAFGISPNTLEATDASQLLGLVVAQEALKNAGYADNAAALERTSVILGVTGTLQLAIPLGARLGHPIWRKALAEGGAVPVGIEWLRVPVRRERRGLAEAHVHEDVVERVDTPGEDHVRAAGLELETGEMHRAE